MASVYQVISTLFLLSLSACVLGQQPSIELQITESNVKPGHDVTLTCRVTNKGDNAVQLAKVFQEVDGTVHTDILATNAVLITQNKRYKLDMIPIGDVKLFNLVISDAIYQDSGTFVCAIAEDLTVRGAVELFVYHPVSELSFNNYTAGERVHVNESTELDLVCQASGSIPAASIKVTLGDEDITGKFRKNIHSSAQCVGGSATSKDCQLHATHSITATMPDFKPKWIDNGKRLSCLASVEGSNFDVKEISFLLDMQYGPKLIASECQSMVSARLMQDYDISCKMNANPTDVEFYWSFMWGGKALKLYNGQSTDDGEFSANHKKNRDGSITVNLHVNGVSKRHLMTYHLNANNTLGSNETTIKLQEDTSDINAAPSLSSTIVTFFSLIPLLRIIL